MQSDVTDLTLVIILGSAILLALAFFIVVFLLFFRQKQRRNQAEKQMLIETYERETLRTQLETQNQTLHQVAEELHDHIGQMMSLIVLHLQVLAEDLSGTSAEKLIGQTLDVARSTIRDVRDLSKTLDSSTLGRFSLTDNLQFEMERIGRTGRFQTSFFVEGTPDALGPQVEMMLFRMAQESLNNAIKHSGAKMLTIKVLYQPTLFSMVVADDGRGFSVADVAGRPLPASGAGLLNLYRRAELLGGYCEVDGQPGLGVVVTIGLPLPLPENKS